MAFESLLTRLFLERELSKINHKTDISHYYSPYATRTNIYGEIRNIILTHDCLIIPRPRIIEDSYYSIATDLENYSHEHIIGIKEEDKWKLLTQEVYSDQVLKGQTTLEITTFLFDESMKELFDKILTQEQEHNKSSSLRLAVKVA